MALGDEKKLIYLSIMNGRVVQRVHSSTEGAVSRENKKGDTVFEKTSGYVVGTIEGISCIESKEYDDQYKILLTDFESKPIEEYALYVTKSGLSSVTAAIIGRLRVIDYNRPVMISPFLGKNGKGEDKTYCTVKQKDPNTGKWVVVPAEFTKEKPGEMPPLTQTTFNNKPALDGTLRVRFYDRLVEIANNKLKEVNQLVGRDRQEEVIKKLADEIPNEAGGDDLPF